MQQTTQSANQHSSGAFENPSGNGIGGNSPFALHWHRIAEWVPPASRFSSEFDEGGFQNPAKAPLLLF
jgi:hypothetical protein